MNEQDWLQAMVSILVLRNVITKEEGEKIKGSK